VKQINENILITISNLTTKPGVYKFIDKNGKIIYIGKAKNLKKRVSSYFTKEHTDTKTLFLVSKIEQIEFTAVNSESDALLLENNLIKEYKPKYNILLKDDKTYPWLCISKEMFPKLYKTRNRVNDGSQYFGPYSSGLFLKNLLELIRQLFQLRNCHYVFNEENIQNKKYKVCLEYHIGNCKAPCIGLQNEQNYDENIAQIMKILKGDYHSIKNTLINKMNNFSADLKFEEAQEIKSKLDIFEYFQSKSVVVSSTLTNIDVFSIINEKDIAYVNYLMIVNGAIVQTHNLSLKKNIEESESDILLLAIQNSRELFESISKEIIIPFKIDFEIPNTKFTIPERGEKKHLLELSEKNAKHYRHDVIMHKLKADYGKVNVRLLELVMSSLHLPELPVHMECFDNSNIGGDFAVASCVVFINGKPSKKDYRHFNIKTVIGPDDFASMAEIIERRYKRLLDENQHLPQLIIVDGGKGQLGVAYEVLTKLGISNKVSLISIAKKLEEIFVPNDPLPLYLDKRSEVLKLIQRMRDEAHRFGITFHRNKRSKALLTSDLNNIKGIGDKTIEMLLKEFKSVENLKVASPEEIKKIVGKSKTGIILKLFNIPQN
jgi:excinuclease ABC subunit C